MPVVDRYIIPGVALIAIVLIILKVPSTFLIILIAVILATLLEPVTRFFANIIESVTEKRNSQMIWDISSVLGICFGISAIILFIWIIFPIVYAQIMVLYGLVSNEDFYTRTIKDATNFVKSHNIWFMNNDLVAYVKRIAEPQLHSITSNLFNKSLKLITELGHSGKNLISSIITSIHNIFNSTLAFILTFHILREWNLWQPRFNKLRSIPIIRPFYPRISMFMNLLSSGIANWIRGQLVFAILMSIYYILLFSSIKLSNSIAVGFIFGFGCFMPYIGDIIAFTLLSTDILYSGIVVWKIIAISCGIGLGHAIGGHLIGPLVIGNKIGLHPIEFIIGFMINASLFGFIGVILNVPFCIIANSLIRSVFSNIKDKHME